MSHNAANNRYVDLVRTKPESLLDGTRGEVNSQHLQYLREREGAYRGVICELGSGSGSHLIERARQEPEMLFVGFELRFKRSFRTIEKAEAAGVKNLILIRTDLRRIGEYFSASSVSGIYINFPDPWDKRRWLKHRIMTPEFVIALAELLVPGGFLAYKTDHANYYEDTVAVLGATPGVKITRASADLYSSPYLPNNVPTEFEMLFRSQGQPVFFVEALRSE